MLVLSVLLPGLAVPMSSGISDRGKAGNKISQQLNSTVTTSDAVTKTPETKTCGFCCDVGEAHIGILVREVTVNCAAHRDERTSRARTSESQELLPCCVWLRVSQENWMFSIVGSPMWPFFFFFFFFWPRKFTPPPAPLFPSDTLSGHGGGGAKRVLST